MKAFKVGDYVEIFEDGKHLMEGYITELYEGTENGNPCLGVYIDDSNGLLIDPDREIKLKQYEEAT